MLAKCNNLTKKVNQFITCKTYDMSPQLLVDLMDDISECKDLSKEHHQKYNLHQIYESIHSRLLEMNTENKDYRADNRADYLIKFLTHIPKPYIKDKYFNSTSFHEVVSREDIVATYINLLKQYIDYFFDANNFNDSIIFFNKLTNELFDQNKPFKNEILPRFLDHFQDCLMFSVEKFIQKGAIELRTIKDKNKAHKLNNKIYKSIDLFEIKHYGIFDKKTKKRLKKINTILLDQMGK
jgi:hypothetical protein